MRIDIITLFPEMFAGPFDTSMLKKAQDRELASINILNLREFGLGRHKTVDDKPYGGGAGMVLMVEPICNALEKLKLENDTKPHIVLLTPQGKTFDQKMAYSLAKKDWIILIAGHYEGFDERIREHLVDEQISIGNYVLTGGELPAMVITDAVVRLIPGVLDEESLKEESYSENNVLEYPQYTRPEEFQGWKVPEVLLSGHHAMIEKWRDSKKKRG